MKLRINPYLSQNDPKWKSEKLGTSTVSTIGNYGCLLTCAAMACNYFGKDTDPSKLNQAMKKTGGFHGGSNWVWSALTDVYPDITFDWDIWESGQFYTQPADLTIIDDLLEQKLPVFVHVDFNPGGEVEQHWVLIKGKENDQYICQDPWPYPGEEYFFKARYGDPERYIFAIRAYRGEVEHEPTDEDKIFRLEEQAKALTQELANERVAHSETRLLLQDARGDLKDEEADHELTRKELNKRTGERDQAVREKEDCQRKGEDAIKKVESLSKDLSSAQDEIKRLKSQLSELVGTELDKFTIKQMITEVIKRILKK